LRAVRLTHTLCGLASLTPPLTPPLVPLRSPRRPVLLTTESFPTVIDQFSTDFVGSFFSVFIVLGYFVFMAYVTAIVFDAYYEVKIEISLKEYLTEKAALATAFLCIAYDPVTLEYSQDLTLNDLLRAEFVFNGLPAGFNRITELFTKLDVDANGSLDEKEFYHFCDAVVSQVESEDGANYFVVDEDGRVASGSLSQGGVFGDMWICAADLRARVDDGLVRIFGKRETHVLFQHILQIFKSGLLSIFFLLAFIWLYTFAVMGMYAFGTKHCIEQVTAYHGLDDEIK